MFGRSEGAPVALAQGSGQPGTALGAIGPGAAIDHGVAHCIGCSGALPARQLALAHMTQRDALMGRHAQGVDQFATQIARAAPKFDFSQSDWHIFQGLHTAKVWK